ncbi:MAG: sugar transferase [Desulfotignum sp.]|nr:sugar transferase [Desulfotignum sp.]
MFSDQKKYLHLMQITSDFICLALVYLLFIPLVTISIAKGTGMTLIEQNLKGVPLFYKSVTYLGLSPLYIFIPASIFLLLRQYSDAIVSSVQIIFVKSLLLSITACLILTFLLTAFDISLTDKSIIITASTGILFISLVLNRLYLKYLVAQNDSNENIIKHLLIIGTDKQSKALCNFIVAHPESGLRVTGFLTGDKEKVNKKISGRRVIGEIRQFNWIIHQYHINCVVYAQKNEHDDELSYVLNNCAIMGIDFATVTHSSTQNTWASPPRKSLEHIGDFNLSVYKFVYYRPRALFIKRAFDFCASLGIIMACTPIWIVVPILIKLSSPGPVFFKQIRIGKHGKRFVLLKFRSMIENAEQMQKELIHLNEMDGPAFKIKKDPRLTLIGRQLRRFSLDELPQLFNVFLGDISLIGPRPATEEEVAQYTPLYRKRLSVTQGITCIWQVSGRNDIKFDEWMKLDLIYINNRSTAQDMKILLRTVPAVIFKKGAY